VTSQQKGKGVVHLKGMVHSIDKFGSTLNPASMARKLRVQYPGAIYHLMNRGDHREDIFLDNKDRELFLETLAQESFSGCLEIEFAAVTKK
jgi:hypothetical protein